MPPPRPTTTARPPPRRAVDHASLLSPLAYDDDAASLNSRSDQDTDSEDDELQLRARNSRELRAHDRIVLMEEEELDRLVTDQRREQERRRAAANLALPNPFEKIEQLVLGRRNSSSSSMTVNEEDAPERREKNTTNNNIDGNKNKDNRDAGADRRSGRRARRDERKRRLLEDAQHGEDGALMHEMERGHMKEGSSTGDSSDLDGLDDDDDDDDDDDYDDGFPGHKGRGMAQQGRGHGWKRWAFVWLLTTLGFAILVLAAWKATNAQRAASSAGTGAGAGASPPRRRLVSNGTALFAPTTIILSLDGFRADFLQRGLTPSLGALAAEGVSPRHMLPSFPSVTFPNHHTLATGLYPEAHGVVGNTFWDPALGAQFYYTDKARSRDPRWWGGEPFWATAERQGARAAVHMWPGSDAHIRRAEASIVDAYNGKEALGAKVARILGFLDMPGEEEEEGTDEQQDGGEKPVHPAPREQQQQLSRPQLIAAYVPNVDADGHLYGPNSTEIRATIRAVDDMLGALLAGLAARNLTHIVNVIVVSDHGMATTDVSRLLQLEDLVDASKIEHVDGWPLYGLRPRDPRDLAGLHAALVDKKKALGAGAGFDVYLRDVDMPARWHFSRNERIAPLWIVPWAGWAIVKRDEFVVEGAREKGLVYHPRGLHGYDHEHPLMRAIFIARGPAFANAANSEVEVFQNIEVYNLVCDSLGITPSPNNGTLRLPLKTIGPHKVQDWPEVPDPETATAAVSTRPSTAVSSSAPARSSTTPASSSSEAVLTKTSPGVGASVSASTIVGTASATVSEASQTSETQGAAQPTTTTTTTTTPTPGGGHSGAGPDDSLTDKLKGVWEWVKDEFGKAWGKIQGGGSEGQSS